MNIIKSRSPVVNIVSKGPPTAEAEDQKVQTSPNIDTLQHFSRRPSGSALSNLVNDGPPAPLLGEEKRSEVGRFKDQKNNEMSASFAHRLELYEAAKTQVKKLETIIYPDSLTTKEIPSIQARSRQLRWINQTSRTSAASFSGVAGEAAIIVLEDIANSRNGLTSGGVFHFVSERQKEKSKLTITLIRETAKWDHFLGEFMLVEMGQGPDGPKNRTLALTKKHVALNLYQFLQIHKKVLIPVSFHAVSSNYDVKGFGHASLLLIEKSVSGDDYDLHYFETDGPRGGRYRLSDVQKKAGTVTHWSNFVATEMDLKNDQEQEFAETETRLRIYSPILSSTKYC